MKSRETQYSTFDPTEEEEGRMREKLKRCACQLKLTDSEAGHACFLSDGKTVSCCSLVIMLPEA